ncbi:nucleotide-diphospho-sugar transferase [Mycena rebaudengoi]|nr:nucleotide-diphospho-sugar transferase [Mycena rebaudengoi]
MLSLKRPLVVSVLLLGAFYFLFDSTALESPHAANEYEMQEFKESKPPNPVAKIISNLLKIPYTGVMSEDRTSSKLSQEILSDATQRDSFVQLEDYTTFPAYIWQTWKTLPTSSDFKEQYAHRKRAVIADEDAAALVRRLYSSVPPVLDAYDALPLPVLKADFFRYLILLARGGVYSDIDTTALKPVREWLSRASISDNSTIGLVVGVEADAGSLGNWRNLFPRRIQLCQWTIQAKPGHPVLRAAVANITKEALQRKETWMHKRMLKFSMNDILELTGPGVWTDVIFEYFNDARYFDSRPENLTWKDFTDNSTAKSVGDTVVFPITSFSPDNRDLGALGVADPMAFVKHGFQGSWKPEETRRVGDAIFDTSDDE